MLHFKNSRRNVLTGASALGAAALLPKAVEAQRDRKSVV